MSAEVASAVFSAAALFLGTAAFQASLALGAPADRSDAAQDFKPRVGKVADFYDRDTRREQCPEKHIRLP